jgi:uncharacterized metal-binding protein YceD (DUF177 family)
MSEPEFSHIIDLRFLEEKPLSLAPSKEQCAALAKRFSLVAIKNLTATLTLTRDANAVLAKGRLKAAIVQSCAVSAEDLPVQIDQKLFLRFVPEAEITLAAEEELELTEEDCDEIFFDGERFDLGEAVAQSLALAIDPFAIGPEAEKVRASGLLGDEKLSPFAALAALKKPD